MDLEKNVQILSAIWPVLITLMGAIYGSISNNFRIKALEKRNDDRDKSDKGTNETLKDIGAAIAGIEKSQAVIAAKMEYIARPSEHR
jgi:hypothetical protein